MFNHLLQHPATKWIGRPLLYVGNILRLCFIHLPCIYGCIQLCTVCGAVIMVWCLAYWRWPLPSGVRIKKARMRPVMPMCSFTLLVWWWFPVQFMSTDSVPVATDPHTKSEPTNFGCPSICMLLLSTLTVTVCYCYWAHQLTLVLPSC